MRAVITVIGKDMVGILAKVSTRCAEHQINVLEVTLHRFRGSTDGGRGEDGPHHPRRPRGYLQRHAQDINYQV